MNISENENFMSELKERFPGMYDSVSYLGCNKGWWPLIKSLSSTIFNHVKYVNERRAMLLEENKFDLSIPDEVKPVKVEQIKEKFGSLRFYYTGGDCYVDGAVSMAENLSSHTCEICGNLGSLREGRWLKTLCDTHR